MNGFMLVATLLALGAAPPCPPTAERNPAVRRLLYQVIEAHGGRECLAKRKCYYCRSEGIVSNRKGTWKMTTRMWSRAPEQVRSETEYRAGDEAHSEVQVWSGGRVWVSVDGVTKELPRNVRTNVDVCYYTRLLPLQDDPQLKVTLLPERKVNGRLAVGLHVSGSGRTSSSLFFDKKTHLLASVEGLVEHGGEKGVETAYTSGYEKVDGGLWPMKRVRVFGEWRAEYLIKEMKTLDTIDDEKFKKP